MSGRLALTPLSQLSWFGFSENGQLSSYDSKGVLRVFSSQFGGSWLPVFSSVKARRSEDESHWVVGLDANKLFCILCKSPQSYPQVMPKPVLTILELSFPLASSDLGADSLENEFMMRKLHLSQIHKKMEEMVAVGLDTGKYDDEAFNMEAGLDRCILRLISNCCSGDKLVRATELAKFLTLEKSMKGALTLVTRLKLPMLQEKFSSILEERMSNFRKEAGTVGYCSDATIMNEPVLTDRATLPSKFMHNQNSLLDSSLPKPNHVNQQSSLTEPMKPGEQAREIKDNTQKKLPAFTPLAKIPQNSETKRGKNGASIAAAVGQNQKGDINRIGKKNNTEKCIRAEPQRPVNPFAKSSSSKEQSSSLLDSIKKMNVETEKTNKLTA